MSSNEMESYGHHYKVLNIHCDLQILFHIDRCNVCKSAKFGGASYRGINYQSAPGSREINHLPPHRSSAIPRDRILFHDAIPLAD